MAETQTQLQQQVAQQAATGSVSTQFASTSLYVGDLEPNVSETQLYEIFRQFGRVVSIRVCRDLITRRSLGYSYVNFQRAQAAARALKQLNFKHVNGKPIHIMFSHCDDPSIHKSRTATIFIKNLDKGIDNRTLHDTFCAFGEILSCMVAIDASGQSKGFGFVQFEHKESAQIAIEKVNGMLLMDKQVFVGPFVRRQERDQGGGASKFNNVYVKNLAESTGDNELWKAFEAYGPISSAAVIRDAEGRSKCFGFVNFQHAEDASKAVEALNGKKFEDKEWFVGRAQKFSPKREAELRAEFEQMHKERIEKYQGVNLYLKNLDDTFDDEKLRELFADFETITSCRVMKDPQAQSRGSGFVGPLGVPDKGDCQSSSQKEGFQSTYRNEVSANLEPGTSQGKNRDDEIHQFSQHGEGLVTYLDQVGHFVITENGNFEEENLQKSLQHMLIGLQRHGEAAATNLDQFHAECMGDSIFVAAREVVEGCEFLFSDAQCMSRMVGVGLERAKVLVTSGYEVGVMQLSENNWKRSWEKVFSQVKDSESSELVAIKMPKLQGNHVKSMSLPAEDISRKFGVSLKDFPETHVITLNCEEEQSGQFFPLVWKVVDEYRNLKCGSTCATTEQTSGTGSTKSPNTSSSGSIQQSTSGGGPNFSQSPSLTRQEEKMDDDEDDDKSLPPEDPLPPDPSSAPNDMRNRRLKVSIFPGAGGAFHDPDTKQPVQQRSFRKEATIMPVIEIEFLQEGIDKKFITVTTKTQCNLGTDGGPKWRGVNFFSWYQNNIKISFKGNDRQTQLLSSSASAQDDSLIETKLTINKALMASTSSSQEESHGAGGQIHIAGSGVQGQIDIKATETQGGNLTIANTQEIGGIKQIQGFIVHPRCRENDLVFNFCLPSRLMPGSSTQSGIDLQSLSQCDDTFEPKVTGKWIVWSDDQHACYVFKVRRYLYRLPSSELHQDEIKCLMQDYKLLMFVNLAMTHLDRYDTNDIVRLTERNPELPYVIKVTPGG